MRALLADLLAGRPGGLAHVIHIGAGTGSDLPAYLEAGAGMVTLVEADPEMVSQLEGQLEGQVGGSKGVKIIEAAVSGDLRRRVFRRANAPELSSFRKPTGLKELFPGLRTLSADPVRPADPVRLIKSLDLPEVGSETGSILLVIEAPGEALGILRALEAGDLLMRFDAIRLQEGVTRLYHKAATAGEIRDYLAGMGFSAALEKHPDDPERPYVTARLDARALKQKRESEALAKALEAMRAQNEQLNEQLNARHDAARKEAEGLRADLAAEMAAEMAAELGTAQEETGRELEGLRAELAAAQQQSYERAEQIRAHMAAREEAGRELEGLRAELTAAREGLHTELEELRADLAGLQQQYQERGDQIGALSAAREAIHKEAEAARAAQTTAEHRLAQAREEMLRADGQISLIRDLLLHGPGL